MSLQFKGDQREDKPKLPGHLFRTVVLALGVGAVSQFFGEGNLVEDASAMALALFLLGTGRHELVVLLSSLLFWLAFPPLCLPTYWFALAPLAWLWRSRDAGKGVAREALLFALVSFWLLTPFVRGANPTGGWYLVYAVGLLLFSVQFVAIAFTIRLLRRHSLALAALAAALTAVAFEWLYSSALGSFLVLFLPAAGSPLAQLAFWITSFGVSFLLYLVNFCLLPSRAAQGRRRWRGTVGAVALASAALLAGLFVSWSSPERPLPVSALLVQPQHADRFPNGIPPEREYRWVVLDRLTREALRGAGDFDLIVWPETALEPSYWQDELSTRQGRLTPASRSNGLSMTLADFASNQFPEYRATCLVGVTLREGPKGVYNSACGLTQGGAVWRYDKQKLLWLVERLPVWLDLPWVHEHVLPRLDVHAGFQPGASAPGIFTFTTQAGKPVKAGVTICYDLFFHDLPQFRPDQGLDVIVHITNDSLFRQHTAFYQYEVWMCQYRAIQTRSWQLLCNNWSHSAVIDPKGWVIRCLPPGPAVLATERR
jgi:apolipoprotein N-acyltransferase